MIHNLFSTITRKRQIKPLPPPLLPNGFAAPDILNKVVARVWLQGSLICLGWGNNWLKADRVLLLGKGFWHSTNVETC